MNLFWRNGYETTSMHMLEKEMGINKFSIYSSFGNKEGVFLESIKCYKQRLHVLIDKLKGSDQGLGSIKAYFYDFVAFSREGGCGKGCLVTNTANELGPDAPEEIRVVLSQFTAEVRAVFAHILKKDESFQAGQIDEVADYLIISMFGLASASRVFSTSQLKNYIENIFHFN